MSHPSYMKLGAVVAAITFAIDQGHKWWMLGPFNIAERQPVSVAPFLDLVLAWNRGVSYGWFSSSSQTGRWILVAVMSIGGVTLRKSGVPRMFLAGPYLGMGLCLLSGAMLYLASMRRNPNVDTRQ